jgi:hypothetical protein
MRTSQVREIYIGGSFVTSKTDPNDLDCLLVFDETNTSAIWRPFEYNWLCRRATRRRFGEMYSLQWKDPGTTKSGWYSFSETAKSSRLESLRLRHERPLLTRDRPRAPIGESIPGTPAHPSPVAASQ